MFEKFIFKKKWLVLTPFVLLLLYVGVRLVLNYTGFCYEQKRYLTENEMIEIATKYILGGYPRAVDIYEQYGDKLVFIDRQVPKKAIVYKSVDEFLKVNADCCAVTDYGKGDSGGKGEEISLFSRLSGSISGFVRVRYKVRYYDSDGDIITVEQEPYIAISNCGRPWSGI